MARESESWERLIAARGTRLLLDAARDVRFAVRQMRKRPTSAVVAALSLGLSIGAIVAIFSLVDAVLLRPMPVAAPDRLVLFGERTGDDDNFSWSVSQFRSFAQSPSLTGACAFRPRTDFSVTRDGRAEVAAGQLLSGGCYQVLGLRPQLGRLFTDDDERAGDARPVAVISDQFWRRQFAADPQVIGRPLELRGRTVTIVGVTPPAFLGLEPGRTIDISLPLSLQPLALPIPMLSSSGGVDRTMAATDWTTGARRVERSRRVGIGRAMDPARGAGGESRDAGESV
jgi:hypothetical protein